MKIAVSTTCSDGYLTFLEHFIKSILKHNPDFDKDFLIYCDGRLSKRSRDVLNSLYSGFKYIEVDYDLYLKNGKNKIKYYSIECFNPRGYDCVIYWGCDMLCKGDLTPLWITAEGVPKVAMPKEKRRWSSSCPFNNGSMIVGRECINDKTYKALLSHDINKPPYNLTDQKLYNMYFKDIQEISQKYNTLVSEIQFIDWDDIIILHYMYKPTVKGSIDQLNNIDAKLYKLWREYD